MGQEKKFFN